MDLLVEESAASLLVIYNGVALVVMCGLFGFVVDDMEGGDGGGGGDSSILLIIHKEK